VRGAPSQSVRDLLVAVTIGVAVELVGSVISRNISGTPVNDRPPMGPTTGARTTTAIWIVMVRQLGDARLELTVLGVCEPDRRREHVSGQPNTRLPNTQACDQDKITDCDPCVRRRSLVVHSCLAGRRRAPRI
jgi:hypothetical protein